MPWKWSLIILYASRWSLDREKFTPSISSVSVPRFLKTPCLLPAGCPSFRTSVTNSRDCSFESFRYKSMMMESIRWTSCNGAGKYASRITYSSSIPTREARMRLVHGGAAKAHTESIGGAGRCGRSRVAKTLLINLSLLCRSRTDSLPHHHKSSSKESARNSLSTSTHESGC